MPNMPTRRPIDSRDAPSQEEIDAPDRDRFMPHEDFDESPSGQHMIHRTTGARTRRPATRQREPEPEVEVEVDPEPSNAADAGKAIGEFAGAAIDGLRGSIRPSTLLLLASLAGLGAGAGGSAAVRMGEDDVPTNAQADLLMRALQESNVRIAALEARVEHMEADRREELPPSEVRAAVISERAILETAAAKAAVENATLEQRAEEASKR